MKWSVEEAKETYNVLSWGEHYIDVSPDGDVIVRPYRDAKRGEINLKALLREVQQREISLPLLIRFQDILNDRIERLCQSFDRAFKHYEYAAGYTAVYPIKVNQQFSVVSEILKRGAHRVGLEAGSKPELLAVLSLAKVETHTIICNGYKDREYIRLALMARRLGHTIFIVLEKVSELALVIEEAEKLQVEPLLGLRLKLASMGKGKWQNTGGEKAKFGLTAEQIITVIETLEQQKCSHWIQLLHFHMGSQIASLNDIETGLAEAAQYFIELDKLGVKINVLDIGGGIGVDYEGRASRTEFSVNYSLDEYADAVIKCFSQACANNHLLPPDIITEAGRAMTAHHAVLVTDVINAEQNAEAEAVDKPVSESTLLQRAYWLYEESEDADAVLIYQQMNALYKQAQSAFTANKLAIKERAALEKIYQSCCQRIKKRLSHDDAEQQQILNQINEKLADKLVCNFSIFQSVPDVWGISQIFPIMPLQRLDQRPDRRAIIQDLTCDSDGQIEQYVDRYGIETTLPVHQIQEHEKYLLGIFMVGAYQEILGDMHNLFGDANTVNVVIDEQKKVKLYAAETGDTVSEVLSYVHFDSQQILSVLAQNIESAALSESEKKQYIDRFRSSLNACTYLD
ncbi:MAG: biosynthetic arginine decarboxylase [Gammaproteobacteria bacterium]|nr:biosynthetic arginine decarboxylase [Gammaproteobacteria bacterium]